MNLSLLDKNPFDLTKASDFTDFQINEYWVDMTDGDGGLINLIKPCNVMPMFLLGSKGCGKTHLMRYCSVPVQIMRNENNIMKVIENEKYIGVYIRADALNAGRFSGKGFDDQIWYPIFSCYFEIWITINLLKILQQIAGVDDRFDENVFIKCILEKFDIEIDETIDNISTLIAYLEKRRKTIDNVVNNCAITRKLEYAEVLFSPGNMIFEIPQILGQMSDTFTNVVFLYLIDEVENFNIMQQTFLNTLIRYRRGANTAIKIGARLYGIKTRNTNLDAEPIKEGAEYEKIELDKFLREGEEKYSKFIKKLIVKRIEKFYVQSSDFDQDKLNIFFEELNSNDYYKDITLKIVASSDKDNSERKYFEKFKRNIEKYTNISDHNQIISIISLLKVPQYPLLEKINILIFYQQLLKKDVDFLSLANSINLDANNFIRKEKNLSKKYEQTFQHFSNDMLAQIYRDYSKNIPYAGLKTIIHMSQGAPRNALGLLKNIYRRSVFNGERPFTAEKITIESQTEGIMDTADWFWDDAQPDQYGVNVRIAIENVAVLFRNMRYCNKPSEKNLSAFSVDINRLSGSARNTLKNAENWSYLIRNTNGRKNKNSQEINELYQLAPILAPRWGLSHIYGGTIEIAKDFADTIFDGKKEDFKKQLEKRLMSTSFEYGSHSNNDKAGELFDEEN